EPWLLAIAGNRCRTALSNRRKPVQSLSDDLVPDATPSRDGFDQLDEEIRLALCGLRVEYRRAFSLFHQEGLSYEEVSQRMHVPVGTVKTWVHRARRELIRQLKEREVVQEPRHALRRV